MSPAEVPAVVFDDYPYTALAMRGLPWVNPFSQRQYSAYMGMGLEVCLEGTKCAAATWLREEGQYDRGCNCVRPVKLETLILSALGGAILLGGGAYFLLKKRR